MIGEEPDGNTQHGHRDGPYDRRPGERDYPHLSPQDLESNLEAAHHHRDSGCRRRRILRQPGEERDWIRKRRDDAGQHQADKHGAAHIAAVTACILPQYRQTEPTGDAGVENDGKRHSEHVNAVVARIEQARENDDVQQPEHGREHIGKKVNHRLADEHDVGTTRPR